MRIALVVITGSLCAPLAAQDVEQSAQDVDVVLEYAPAAQCPDDETFAELVTSRLGRNPFVESSRDVVRVSLSRRGRVHSGTLAWLRDAEELGRRELEVRGSCDELVESLAVGLTILLEDPPVEPSPVTEPEPEPDPDPEPARRLAPEPIPIQEPPPPEPGPTIDFIAEIGGAFGFAITPRASIGARIAIGVRIGMLSLRLEGTFDSQIGEASVGSNDRIEATHGTGALAGCAHYGVLFGCLHVGAGAFSARVTTVADPRTRTSTSAFVGGRLGVAWQATPALYVAPFAELQVALTRTALDVDGPRSGSSPRWVLASAWRSASACSPLARRS